MKQADKCEIVIAYRIILVQYLEFPCCPQFFLDRIFAFLYECDERGSIVVRAHASLAEGLRFEPDSMP